MSTPANILITIDCRERELIAEIDKLRAAMPEKFGTIQTCVENLPIGDIILSQTGAITEELLIIERKTVADLAASIKDGRYDEQSFRLQGLTGHHNHNILYLIEGQVTGLKPAGYNKYKPSASSGGGSTPTAEQLVVYSAMFSLNYYKGFSVIRSFSLQETVVMLCNMACKLKKELSTGGGSTGKNPFYSSVVAPMPAVTENSVEMAVANPEETQTTMTAAATTAAATEYAAVVKRVKKENITGDNIGLIMLTQIPGVSSVFAEAILKKYDGSLVKLMLGLQENPECLSNITYATSAGQTRKVNRPCIEAIVRYLSAPGRSDA